MATATCISPSVSDLPRWQSCKAPLFSSSTFSHGGRRISTRAQSKKSGTQGNENKNAEFPTQLLKFVTRRGNADEEVKEIENGDSDNPLDFVLKTISGKSTKGNSTTRSGRKELTPLEALSLGRLRRTDPKTVFVAGATGQIGARISQQLLRNGFNVRAGVRDLAFAQQLAEFALQYGVISREEARRLNAVECEFEDVESIAKAVGNAGKVVVTVGSMENGPRGRVSADDALMVVEAANVANVGHLVIVYESPSITKVNALTNITGFFSKIFNRGSSEITLENLLDRIVETDLKFTFLKTNSTDGVDDFSPVEGNVVLLSEGTYNEGTGKVSKAQLASVVASVFSNVATAENKVVEVASLKSAPARPIDELLSGIPVDGRRAALLESAAKAEAEEREREMRAQAEEEASIAMEEARKATKLAAELEQEAKKFAAQEAKALKAKAKADKAAASYALNKTSSSSSSSSSVAASLASSAGQSFSFIKGIDLGKAIAGRKSSAADSSDVGKSTGEIEGLNKKSGFLGGLFKQQETIYVDD